MAPRETDPLLHSQQCRDAPSYVDSDRDLDNTPCDEASHDGDAIMMRKMHLFIPAVGIGLYLVAVDQLLTVAAYAKIGNELNALNNISWFATSYFLTLTSCQPLYGKLSDIFGRKECLLFSYVVFAVGCLGCGLARNMVQLCLARGVAGVGGGGMSTVVSIVMSDIVPLRERGVWQGYLNIIYAAGTATGAPLGGFLADTIGWRVSFLAQIPLCCVAWIAVYFVLEAPKPSHTHWFDKLRKIDFCGALLLVLAVFALLAGLDSGSNLGWRHWVTSLALTAAPLLFALFVLVEVKLASHPFAPGHIIFGRGLLACYLANFFGIAAQVSILFSLPLFFQIVEAHSASVSGALLVPGMVATMLASVAGGQIIKSTGKFYAVTVLGYGVQAFGILPLVASLWSRTTAQGVVGLSLTAAGSGFGLVTTLVGLLANAAVEDSAVVVACTYLFRSLGSSIGVSVSSAVLQQVLRTQLAMRLQSDEGETSSIIDQVRRNMDSINHLPRRVAQEVRTSYQVATLGSFVATLIFSFLAFMVTFLIREKPLRK